jgi:hypothetical protein
MSRDEYIISKNVFHVKGRVFNVFGVTNIKNLYRSVGQSIWSKCELNNVPKNVRKWFSKAKRAKQPMVKISQREYVNRKNVEKSQSDSSDDADDDDDWSSNDDERENSDDRQWKEVDDEDREMERQLDEEEENDSEDDGSEWSSDDDDDSSKKEEERRRKEEKEWAELDNWYDNE